MHPLVNIALRAGRDAAGVLAQQSERLDRIRLVETEAGQQVTSVEAEADKSLLYHIRGAYPKHNVNSRISGEHPGKPEEPTWHLDPVIGMDNLLHGFSAFGVALAIEINKKVNHAAVLFPSLQEEFTASRGSGAQLNARRLRVRNGDELKNTLIGVNPTDLDSTLLTGLIRELIGKEGQFRALGIPPSTYCRSLQAATVVAGVEPLPGRDCKRPCSCSKRPEDSLAHLPADLRRLQTMNCCSPIQNC